jgi:hypothetical protein
MLTEDRYGIVWGELRRCRGISVRVAAALLGGSESYLQAIEDGKVRLPERYIEELDALIQAP